MKKGFIFIETLIVLIVLLVTVVGMYGMYIKISTDIDNRSYYDNISDLYKIDILRNNIREESISGSGLLSITKDNCAVYMNSDCSTLMSSLKAQIIYINLDPISSLVLSEINDLPNSLKSYLKTINNVKAKRYIIVNFKYNDKNYYGSLRI